MLGSERLRVGDNRHAIVPPRTEISILYGRTWPATLTDLLMTTPHLDHRPLTVERLINEYNSGQIVIPEFQRDYVWKKGKAPLLLDSLYKGYPISSLLLWQSDEPVRARRAEPRPAHASRVSWLIDGQQRVTTLARTLSGDQGIDVVFNADQEEFLLANAATRQNPSWVRVAELWNPEDYRRLTLNLDSGSAMDRKRNDRYDRVRRILEYEVPLVRMIDHNFKDAVAAFERINTLGIRLKREDIDTARVASRHTGFIAENVAPFLKTINHKGFDRLNVMHLFRACAFVAKPDGRNRTPLHDLEKTDILKAWKKTEQGTEQAISLIKSELGLVSMNILWSGALLVPVIAMCANLGPRERDSKGMIAWLALAALHHRYSASSETKLDEDLKACRESDPIGALLKNLRQNSRASLFAEPADFEGALADKSGLLALYIACMHRGILNFYTGDKILLQDGVDRHHILPRAQFSNTLRASADNVANIAFIVGDVNRAISHSGPEVYLKQLERKVLSSQCIPLDQELWTIAAAEDFWKARRRLLADSFNEFLKHSLVGRRLGST